MKSGRAVTGIAIALAWSQTGYSCFGGQDAPPPQAPPPAQYGWTPCPHVAIPPDTMQAYPMLPDVLGTLKSTLVQDAQWPSGPNTVAPQIRHEMARILDDPALVFEYSPPLGPMHSGKVVAAQTIDARKIRLSKFAAGPSGRDPYVLAQTVAHELVHVYQIRFQNKPIESTVEPIWEIPAYSLEGHLPQWAFRGALASCSAPAPPALATGPCRERRVRPGPAGFGEWVAWSTGVGWLRVGKQQDFARQQHASDDIWGGDSNMPIVKTKVAGPWMTREQAIDEITSGLSQVTVTFHPTTAPTEITEGTYGGRRYYLRLLYGESDMPMRYLDYVLPEEIAILNQAGISPRLDFGGPHWLVHLKRGGTLLWISVRTQPQGKTMTLPWDDGTVASYDLLASHGPFTESFGMWTSMKTEGLESVGELGSSRTITTKWGVEPYVDHGSPLCN